MLNCEALGLFSSKHALFGRDTVGVGLVDTVEPITSKAERYHSGPDPKHALYYMDCVQLHQPLPFTPTLPHDKKDKTRTHDLAGYQCSHGHKESLLRYIVVLAMRGIRRPFKLPQRKSVE